jgi:hypothetical protein
MVTGFINTLATPIFCNFCEFNLVLKPVQRIIGTLGADLLDFHSQMLAIHFWHSLLQL